jgi:hypothetical protein
MSKPCDRNIQRTIELARAMIRLADKGDADREDTGCGILYGILRDSAYKLWRLAEEEKARHLKKSRNVKRSSQKQANTGSI